MYNVKWIPKSHIARARGWSEQKITGFTREAGYMYPSLWTKTTGSWNKLGQCVARDRDDTEVARINQCHPYLLALRKTTWHIAHLTSKQWMVFIITAGNSKAECHAEWEDLKSLLCAHHHVSAVSAAALVDWSHRSHFRQGRNLTGSPRACSSTRKQKRTPLIHSRHVGRGRRVDWQWWKWSGGTYFLRTGGPSPPWDPAARTAGLRSQPHTCQKQITIIFTFIFKHWTAHIKTARGEGCCCPWVMLQLGIFAGCIIFWPCVFCGLSFFSGTFFCAIGWQL